MIQLHLLGGCDLRDAAGTELRSLLAQPKRLALLAYLTIEHAGSYCRRDKLFGLFWPEFDEDRARLALRQALHFLRRSLGPSVVVSRGDEEIGIDPLALWCDAVTFLQAARQGKAEDALAVYRGDLMPGFFLSDASPDFDQWLDGARIRIRSQAAAAAWTLADAAEQSGNFVDAALRAREGVRLAPDDEAALRRLIALLDRVGDRAGALRVHDSFAQRLRQEFELEPSPETRALIESVRARPDIVAPRAAVTAAPLAMDAEPSSPAHASPVVTERKKWRLAAAIGGIGVALGGVATILPRALADAPPLIAVGWVENRAGADLDETARLLPGLLATDLSRVRGLNVLSDARLQEVLSQLDPSPENARAITAAAERAGADQLLQGVLYRRGAELRLDLRRVDIATAVVREAYTAEASDVFDLTDRTTAAIARSFSLDAPGSPSDGNSTGSLAARRLYEQGLHEYYRGEPRRGHDLFAAALAEDTTFALAALFAALSWPDPEGRSPWLDHALRMADDAPDRDRLRIKLATLFNDHASALAVAESLSTRFPSEPDGHLGLAGIRHAAGDFLSAVPLALRVLAMDSLSLAGNMPMCRACDAIELLVGAYMAADSLPAAERWARDWIRRDTTSAKAWRTLAAVLAASGQQQPALAAHHRAETLRPTAGASHTQAAIAIQANDYVEAERLSRTRLALDPTDTESLWNLVIVLRNQGRLIEALALSDRRLALFPDYGSRLAKGQVLFEMGRFREAAIAFDSAAHLFADIVPGPLATRGGLARHASWSHTHTAAALAAAGDTTAVLKLADSIAAVSHFSAYGRDWRLADHVRGLAWVARRQPERAAQAFRAALYSASIGYTRTNLELARILLDRDRPDEAVSLLKPALRGSIDASNYYVTRTELHELLARAFELANAPDSAAVYHRKVFAAWSQGDPPFRARADTARARLARLAH